MYIVSVKLENISKITQLSVSIRLCSLWNIARLAIVAQNYVENFFPEFPVFELVTELPVFNYSVH